MFKEMRPLTESKLVNQFVSNRNQIKEYNALVRALEKAQKSIIEKDGLLAQIEEHGQAQSAKYEVTVTKEHKNGYTVAGYDWNKFTIVNIAL